MDSNKKRPKVWKGNGYAGFTYGACFGFAVGFINILSLHLWHLGIITWIVIWLFMGMNPHFKDTRTKKQISADSKKYQAERDAAKQNKLDKEKTAVTSEPQPVIIPEQQEKPSRKVSHCPRCKSNNIQILDNKKKFSLMKTAAGGFILGVPGAGALIGKRGKKYHAVCMNCGKKFLIKL